MSVRVLPGARKSALAGEENGRLKVRLQAPPVEGKANKALIAFLAGELGLKKNRVELRTGHRSRDKLVLLKGMRPREAADMIESVLRGNK